MPDVVNFPIIASDLVSKAFLEKKILQDWINQNKIDQSLDEIWAIREQCIADLSA